MWQLQANAVVAKYQHVDTHISVCADLHKAMKTFTVESLLQFLPNHVWVIFVNFGQEDQGWNVCMA